MFRDEFLFQKQLKNLINFWLKKSEKGGKMKKIIARIISLVVVISVVVILTGCGASHEKYRGHENAPFTQIQTLQINPNGLSPVQYDELMKRWALFNANSRQSIDNNARAANAERQWTSEGGNYRHDSSRGIQNIFKGATSSASQTFDREIQKVVRDSVRSLFGN